MLVLVFGDIYIGCFSNKDRYSSSGSLKQETEGHSTPEALGCLGFELPII